MRFRSEFDGCTLVAWVAGMVAAQVGCTLDQAAELMESRGVQTQRSLEEIATAVADRRMRFDSR